MAVVRRARVTAQEVAHRTDAAPRAPKPAAEDPWAPELGVEAMKGVIGPWAPEPAAEASGEGGSWAPELGVDAHGAESGGFSPAVKGVTISRIINTACKDAPNMP